VGAVRAGTCEIFLDSAFCPLPAPVKAYCAVAFCKGIGGERPDRTESFTENQRDRETSRRPCAHYCSDRNSKNGNQERCLNAGMEAYLPKPISPRVLKEAIFSLVGSEKGGSARRDK
jgi:hypothetical protein